MRDWYARDLALKDVPDHATTFEENLSSHHREKCEDGLTVQTDGDMG